MHTAVRLAADASSASRARRSVEWFVALSHADPSLAPLVTTELVSNAVRHGAEPIVLLLRSYGNHLLVEVTDCGPGRVAPREPQKADEGGMGLALVTRVATRWGVRRHGPRCKTVWACLDAACVSEVWTPCGTEDGLVSERAFEEREVAAQERGRAHLERKLARNVGRGAPVDWRAAAMHRAAASAHHAAAALHERLASLADQRTQRLFDRYR
jgi:anti-sigma regulatory factor (Ser/Thr protein kinase)